MTKIPFLRSCFLLLFVTLNTASAAPVKAVPIKIISPRESIQKTSGPTLFQWQLLPSELEVEKYELTLYIYGQVGTPPKILSRTTASGKVDTSSELGGGFSPGTYAWKIEAKDRQGAVIGAGQIKFKIVSDLYRKTGSYEVMAGIVLDDYAYSTTFGALSGEVPSTLFGYMASVEYRLPANWSARLDYRNSVLKFAGASQSFSEIGIGGARRSILDKEQNWHLNAGLKLSSVSLPQLTPQVDQTFVVSRISRLILTPSIGVDYRLSENVIVFSRLTIGTGLSLSTPSPVTNIKKGTPFSGSIGFHGNISPPWGYELETTYFRDNFGYTSGSQASETILRGYKVHLAVTRFF